jgi:histidinol dehydrogenase
MKATMSLRFSGRLADLSAVDRLQLLERGSATSTTIRVRTGSILERVRTEGDDALRAMSAEFDQVELEALEVPRTLWREALRNLDPALRQALERAARNIARAHEGFVPKTVEVETEPGIVVGRRPDALGSVGIYAPGGRATYPSSLLMGAIPARVAGVAEIVVCSPPGSTGLPSAAVLAAAELANVSRVFAVGGAGAIAAMAYGTDTIPRVDRIVGPGNAYVAEAKLQLSGVAAFDSPAGPSELLVIADESADPSVIAREMLAQAEHDPLACVVAVVVSPADPETIVDAIICSLGAQPRREIIADSLAANGGVLIARTLEEAVAFANDYAAEHLLLAVVHPDGALRGIRNTGTVFLGQTASVVFGDYMTGANHVLPTNGRARSYSGLSTLDFVRWTTYQRVSRAASARLASDVAVFAEAEGLPGHASAARAWEAAS